MGSLDALTLHDLQVQKVLMEMLPIVDSDDESISRKVYTERVKVFTERAVGGAYASIFGTSLLAWIEAPIAGLKQSIVWFCCINVVEALIIIWGYQYRLAKPSEKEAPDWAKRQIVCAPLVGLAWGSSVWFFWVDGQLLFYIVNLTVLVTVTALTLTIVAPFASATALFTAGILLPILTHLVRVNNPLAPQIAVGLAILFFVQMRYAAIARQQLLSGLDTAQRNAYMAEQLRVNERQMLIAQQISNTGSWTYDPSTGKILASTECHRIFGYPTTARDFSVEEVEVFIPERERVRQSLLALIAGEDTQSLEFSVRPADGAPMRQVHCIARLEKNEKDGRSLVLGFVQDITRSKQLEAQVRHLAFSDSLTKLANRHLLSDRLSQRLIANQRSACYGGLLFMDLDNFKPLNDTYGHASGDLLLIEVANRLIKCVRKGDTVARFGGDEFVVMLNELDHGPEIARSQAQVVAEKIRSSLAEPYLLPITLKDEKDNLVEHRCTASIGAVVFLDHEVTPDEVLLWADTAMYKAKEAGGNAIRFYRSPDGCEADFSEQRLTRNELNC